MLSRRRASARVDSPRRFGKLRVVRPLVNAFALTLVLFTLGAAGCHRDRCVPICEQRAKELGCSPRESCKAKCDELHTAPRCAKELKAFEECFLAVEAKNWMCDEEGLPVVQLSFCGKERTAVGACLESPPAPEIPAPTIPTTIPKPGVPSH
jgi:hypothetical protein